MTNPIRQAKNLAHKYIGENYKCKNFKPKSKDFNEDLLAMIAEEKAKTAGAPNYKKRLKMNIKEKIKILIDVDVDTEDLTKLMEEPEKYATQNEEDAIFFVITTHQAMCVLVKKI